MKSESAVPDFANVQLKEEIEDKTNQLMSVQSELDKIKKDKNITVGLVTQMQKDLSNKVWSSYILTWDESISEK